jgi:hypothetical protein
MPSWSTEDVIRSVRRTVAEILPTYPVALQREEVKDSDRPAGVVEMGRTRTRFARTSVPQGYVIEFAPMTVTLYPPVTTVKAAGYEARRLETLLRNLAINGPTGVTLDDADGRPAAGPERWPLYDYAGIDPEGPVVAPEEDPEVAVRVGSEFPYDVLWLEDYGADAIQDPMDAKRWTVVLEMRVSWERPGAVYPGDPPPNVEEFSGSWAGEVLPEP